MADSPINGFGLTKTTVPAGSYFGFDWYNGTDWNTARIESSVFASALGAPNFFNSNLLATADHTHDGNDKSITVGKLKYWKLETDIAPSLGTASFQYKGYGTTSSNLINRISSDLGTIHEMYGDKSQRGFGTVAFNGLTPDSTVGARATGSYAGVQGTSTSGVGVLGQSELYAVQGVSTNGKGIYGQSTNDVAVYGNGSIGVRGLASGSTAIGVQALNSDGGFGLQTTGKIKFGSGLPTSSTGLSSGDVWNDAGTLKIV